MHEKAPPFDFVFFGTPDVARETLELLKSQGFTPKCIVTAPDRPVGRHFTLTPPPAKVWAMENNIPYLQPEKFDDACLDQIPQADVFVVVAYGKILPQRVIDAPRQATINIHYSLLPRWRGASPVESAILAGDPETGVSIQRMVLKLDAGPIIAETNIPISPNDTTESLRAKLIPLGAELLISVLEKKAFEGTEQDESQATHCGKIKKEDGLVDPFTDDPETLSRKYRAYCTWPGIFFFDAAGKRVKITQARFESGAFIIESVVPEGKKQMTWDAYLASPKKQ